LLQTVVGRVAQLSIADRGSAPRITDSCLTACATTRHKGQVVHANVSHFKICVNAITRLHDVGIVSHANLFVRRFSRFYRLGILDHGIDHDPLAVPCDRVAHLAYGILRPVISIHVFRRMADGNRNAGEAVEGVSREDLVGGAVNSDNVVRLEPRLHSDIAKLGGIVFLYASAGHSGSSNQIAFFGLLYRSDTYAVIESHPHPLRTRFARRESHIYPLPPQAQAIRQALSGRLP